MSATATSLRDPRLLPGVSAFTWARISLIGYLVSLIVWIPLIIFLGVGGFPRSSTGLIAVIIPLGLVPTIAALITRARQNTESAAGYATVLSSGNQLDLLDAHSGAVIWRVGDPPLRPAGLLGTLRGVQESPARERNDAEPAFPAKKASSRAFQILGSVGGLALVFIVFSATHRQVNMGSLARGYLIFAAFAGLVLLIVLLQTRLTIGRRIPAVSALRPEAMIFTSRTTRELSKDLVPLGISRGQSGRFVVVVTDSGMEFWGTSGDAPWLSIPWTEVTRVDPDSTAIGNNSFRAVSLVVQRVDEAASVTLPIYGRQGIFTASPSWANQVFDEIQFHVAKRPPAS